MAFGDAGLCCEVDVARVLVLAPDAVDDGAGALRVLRAADGTVEAGPRRARVGHEAHGLELVLRGDGSPTRAPAERRVEV